MNTVGEYCGILLAAGRSRRFGSDKLLHPLEDGTPVALASANALRRTLPRMRIVVSYDNDALQTLLADHGFDVLNIASTGMGESLAAAVAATADAKGWIVALADMPFIRDDSIAAVITAMASGAPLAAPCHQGRRGHPVGIDRRFLPLLLELGGDQGARQLLDKQRDQLQLIECDDAGVLRDIDTPADL